MFGHYAYYQHVSQMAFWALKSCILFNSTVYLRNLVQQAGETFTCFLALVTEVGERKVENGQTKDMLIEQLTWEGLNTIIHNAIEAVRQGEHPQMGNHYKRLDSGVSSIAALTTSLDALLVAQHKIILREGIAPDRTCWGCGETGHLRRNYP